MLSKGLKDAAVQNAQSERPSVPDRPILGRANAKGWEVEGEFLLKQSLQVSLIGHTGSAVTTEPLWRCKCKIGPSISFEPINDVNFVEGF